MVESDRILTQLQQAGFVSVVDDRLRFEDDWLMLYLADAAPPPPAKAFQGVWGQKAIIGLTGNIAMGKSTVLDMLAKLGAAVIDADRLVHHLREPGQPGHAAVADLFGREILQPDGRIDVAELGKRAFADPDVLRQLEQIFGPLVVAEVERLARESAVRVIVVEAIRLLDGALHERMDSVWVVDAPRAQQIARMVASRGMTAEESETRIDAQPPQSEKLAQADVIIRNDGSLANTAMQVLTGWRILLGQLYRAGWLDESLAARYIAFQLDYTQTTLSAERTISILRVFAQCATDGALTLDAARKAIRAG
jgi:dephospho-CoA kinase